MKFDANGPAGLGQSRKMAWDSLQDPNLPSWLMPQTNDGATFVVQDAATTGGGVNMRPAQAVSAQALINLPDLNLGQYRAVRFRCMFATATSVRGVTMRLGEASQGRGARISKLSYVDEIKLGAIGGNGNIKYLNSRLPRIQPDKRFDFSIVIENINSTRNLYTMQGEQVADVWSNVSDYMWVAGGSVTPGFSVSQHDNPISIADTRVTLHSVSLERWL
jgi:hypothetical protein